ncbi:MAG: hypothetical protein IJ642_00560 [Oscillospiraceae bacterium]|nr:hypothetical protein [Oscillospiraceae bacterium]
MTRKAQQAAQELISQNYDLIRCEAFKQNCDDITRQAIAMVICALAMHGYGKKRLNRIYEWILEILNFPAFFGRKMSTTVAEKKCEELGIDLGRVHVEVEMIDNDI